MAYMNKSILISDKVYDYLFEKKRDLKLRSIDATLRRLLGLENV